MRKIILVILAVLLLPHLAKAQAPPAQPKTAQQTPLRTDLDKVFNDLLEHLKSVDQLSETLRGISGMKPDDAAKQIDKAANTLGQLADRLQPQSNLAGQLKALRNSAAVHRERIQKLAKEAIEESDRTELLKSWDSIVQDADKAGSAMTTMRDRLLGVLGKLRMRQAAASEFMLAGQFQAAIKSFNAWVAELQATVNTLHTLIEPNTPAM